MSAPVSYLLHWACSEGQKDSVLKLANFDSVHYVDPYLGDTPLHQACKQGWLDIVKLFIEKYGCDPNVITRSNQSTLHYACQHYGHIDVVEYLIKKHHLNPLLRDNHQLEPLNYALNNNKTNIAAYICQHCISSGLMLIPYRIETTVNLIKSILKGDTFDPNWKTTNGDNILQLVGSSKPCILHMPSAVMLKILSIGNIALKFQPDWRTADGDNLLELVCQSKTCLSQISSAVILKWLENVTVKLVEISIPDSQTADDKPLVQLVCQSEVCIAHVSTAVLLKWLKGTFHDLKELIITPEWKTADGDALLQLICQSETCLSRIPSTILLKWLNLYLPKITVPTWKTSDGKTLFELVCQSKMCLSQIPSAVFLEWLILSGIPPDHNFEQLVLSDRNTTDGDSLLQLHQSKPCLLGISSTVILKWLSTTFVDLTKLPTLDYKTADDETLIQLVCRSEARISSAALSKWLEDATLDINLAKIIIPELKTADGDTLLQLVFQSETTVSRISSSVLSQWLEDAALDISLAKIIIPELKTADGDTLLQLVFQSETTVSRISSSVLSKWLEDATLDINLAKMIIPELKTADGDTLLQLVFQSETAVSRISSPVLSKWLQDTTLGINLAKIIRPKWKTADSDTLLQLVCQSEICVALVSSSVLLMWLGESTHDLITPEWKTADGDTTLQLVCQSETCLSQISSAVLLKCLRNTQIKHVSISIPDCKTADNDTLLQLVLQSEISILQTSTIVLSKWLSDSSEITIDLMKMVDPNWKTLDGDCFLHVLCQSKLEDKKLIELMQFYVRANGLNPDILDSNENTALHIACQTDKPALVSFLIEEVQCNPCIKNKMENLPLDMTTNLAIIKYLCQHDQVVVYSKTIVQWMNNRSFDDTTILSILTTLVDNHRNRTKDGSTLLHIICTTMNNKFRDKIRLLHYLLTEGHSDPNCLDSKGQMPLQLTLDSKIMKKLVEHGAKMTKDVVFKVISSKRIKDSKASAVLTFATRRGMMLWNPNDLNSNGDTALHLACNLDKQAIVNYLLTKAKCDPNANNLLMSPLQLTRNLEIAKLLIKHGARVTPELVLRFEAMEDNISSKRKIIKLMLTTWNPDDRDSDGYTALHLACKDLRPTTVNILLSVAHCDPNIKSNSEEVPLQMTTNPEIIKDLIRHGAQTSIMYESCQNTLGTNEPVKPPVKVFIVGNPSVGKSSLTAALKKKLNIVARFFTSGKVSEVDQKTVGIVPHEVESDIYGRATLYDFAGHREFYSGHAALLQTAIQSTPPVFLLVVNLYQDDDAITKDIMYWISFLENQCASVNCKPHIILVGSHADFLKSSGANAKDKIKAIIDSLDTKCFINMELVGFVALDCQYHESSGMSDLRRLLLKSCNELRIHEPITFNAHCFLVSLIDTFTNSSAVTINTIYNNIENQLMPQTKRSISEFLPRNFETLYKICLELNDRGHILLLKDRIAVENSYIVIDKEFLLSKISGTVFAPEGFKQYKQLSTNTGVVPRSKIAKCFEDEDLDILIGLLTHLEFCHEISDQGLHQLISEQYSRVSGERYYLFPGLISVQVD